MGLSSATQRKPMISVQNLCDTSRFRTLRTMWLIPRGGSGALAMMPSLIGDGDRSRVSRNSTSIVRYGARDCTRPVTARAANFRREVFSFDRVAVTRLPVIPVSKTPEITRYCSFGIGGTSLADRVQQ